MNRHSLIEKLVAHNEIIIFFGILILTFLLYRLFNKRKTAKCNLPPGPIGLPLVGYLPFLGPKPHRTFRELSKKYGNMFSLYLGQTLTVVCNDWPSTEEAFSKMETTDRPPGLFDALPSGFGHGGASGKEWIEQRRLTVKTMKDIGLGRPQWEELLQEEIDSKIEEIRRSNGHLLDLRQAFSSTFTNNMMTLLFGHRLPSNHPTTVYISDSVDHIIESFATMQAANFLPRLCLILTKLGLYGSKKTLQKLKDFGTFIRDRIDEEMRNHKSDDDSFIRIYHREMKQQKNNPDTYITEKSLYGNVHVLTAGGTETTRTTFIWLILAVTKNPEVQVKIQKELDSVLGKDGKIMWSERAKVPYTYAAIMESMRWKTIVPLNTLRMTNADTKIQGFDVPKGAYIAVNQWALHNDPKFWSEPQKFIPERFLLDEGKQINSNPKSYVPFSFGRRNCPGKLIALMEIFQYFVTIMRNFTILPPEDGKLNYDTILGLTFQAKNLKVRFIPRKEAMTHQNSMLK